MGTRLLVLCCLLAALAVPANGATTQMWVWVDSNGVTHYSDRPVPGAAHLVASMEPGRTHGRPRPTDDVSHTDGAAARSIDRAVPGPRDLPAGGERDVLRRRRGGYRPYPLRTRACLRRPDASVSRWQPGSKASQRRSNTRCPASSAVPTRSGRKIVDAQGKAMLQRATHDPHAAEHRERTARGGPNLRPRPAPRPSSN